MSNKKRRQEASLLDSARTVLGVMAPTIAKGVIVRRPRMVALSERLGLDGAAVSQLQRLRRIYGEGPLLLRMPGPPRAMILCEEDLRRVLDGTPDPFKAASSEKRAALAHFEPEVALASEGPDRAIRRELNEKVLQTGCPVHDLADRIDVIVDQEAEEILVRAMARGELDWSLFFEGWYRTVRRVVLGDGARDDHHLTDMLARLRSRANWAFFAPKDTRLRARFHECLSHYIMVAEEGSLAALMARHAVPGSKPSHQMAQWLFAFDPAGMAVFRTLALLACHPDEMQAARDEARNASDVRLPFTRGCFLEALRLWPTTPAILRETTRPTEWRNGTLPTGTGITIFAPFFHRDDQRLPFAHRFKPELWSTGDPTEKWPLVPFSQGPAECPAKDLVPLTASLMLSRLIRLSSIRLLSHELSPEEDLPSLLNNYTLRFSLA
jgi:hypothetical protein